MKLCLRGRSLCAACQIHQFRMGCKFHVKLKLNAEKQKWITTRGSLSAPS